MTDRTAPIAAVVVGAGENCGGLGLVRSLGQAGVPVFVMDSDPSAPALYSRFARKFVASKMTGTSLVKDLLALRATLDHSPVLFLTSDDAVLTVSEHRDKLGDGFRFLLPSHACVTSLAQKVSFQQLAERHGFPVPRAVRIECVGDLGRLATLHFPCVIKPSVKTAEYLNGQFDPGYKVASVAQADAVCRRILPALPDVLVQEWIEGPDSEIYFCMVYRGASGTVSSFTGRKLSIWPPDIGTTASCTAAPHARAVLEPLTDAFFAAVSFVGMGSIEFKRDARSGKFLMIEPTIGRVDWQEEVATIHGANIPLAAYCYEIGRNVPIASELRPQVIWRDLGRHWKSSRHRAIQDEGAKADIYGAYWRRDDPLPALFYIRRALAKRLKLAMTRVRQLSRL
jgi:D-aspartate ligase